MSYVNGYSEASIVANISAAVAAGYPQDVSVANALTIARTAWRRAHPKGPYPAHLRGMRAPRRRRKSRNRAGRRNRAMSTDGERRAVFADLHASVQNAAEKLDKARMALKDARQRWGSLPDEIDGVPANWQHVRGLLERIDAGLAHSGELREISSQIKTAM